LLRKSQPRTALKCAQRSLVLRRQIGDQWGIALSLFALGRIAEEMQLPHAARRGRGYTCLHLQPPL